jgi:hypothetical protein
MIDAEAARNGKSLELIFAETSNGTPDQPSQSGFLALAHAGRDVWNTWRQSWPMPEGHSIAWPFVDFSNCHFDEELDFNGFEFGDFANFRGATFAKKVDFRNTVFGDTADFMGVSFQEQAQFENAKFGADAQFEGAQFAFGASFSKAQFDRHASFFGAQFGDDSEFDGASFGEDAQFDGCNWAVLKLRYEAQYLRRKQWAEDQEMSPHTFESLSFRGCTFQGEVNFSNREFLGQATWEPLEGVSTTFHRVPKFHNCKLHQDTSFDGAKFPAATGSESAARAYRTMKLASAQQQATREEQRFFKLEMAEEHRSVEAPRRWLYAAYALFSDYGFSTWRPSILLLASLLFAWGSYGWLAGYSVCVPFLSSCAPAREWFEFGLVNAFPLPGLDKYAEGLRSVLFPPHLHPAAQVLVTTVVIVQKTLSLLAFFLIGLALRNLFKMK